MPASVIKVDYPEGRGSFGFVDTLAALDRPATLPCVWTPQPFINQGKGTHYRAINQGVSSVMGRSAADFAPALRA